MIDRICISINNRCNLSCRYCHFKEKNQVLDIKMNVYSILDNVKDYIKLNAIEEFKIGFVGNGEPLLDWNMLKSYLIYLEDTIEVKSYIITNGTIKMDDKEWEFLIDHGVNVGFSLDGYRELHNKNRCGSFDTVIENIENYKRIAGKYPTLNSTVGFESINNKDKIVNFFKKYDTKVTFSRMIGKYAISLAEYQGFIESVGDEINVRKGKNDCTMYGGKCGAGINNFFFSNNKVFLCGNCVDLPPIGDSSMPLSEIERKTINFDRNYCYKELLCE